MKKFKYVLIIVMVLLTAFMVCSCGLKRDPYSKYEKNSVERHIEELGIDPEQCRIEKISEEGESDEYEVSTDWYQLGEEVVFKVFRTSSTDTIGMTSVYWDDDLKENLFYVLYPWEQWPKVLTAHNGYSPDFEVDPMNFYEDIEAVMETTDEIAKAYESHGLSKDMMIRFRVQGRFTDTRRQDGVTVSDLYTGEIPRDLIYQALFEYSHLANINEDNIGEFNSDYYRNRMEKYYLSWAIEEGLVDVYSKFPYEERKAVNGFESNRYYYAVIDGEVTDESEEIFADYKGNLSYSAFYKLLVRQGYPVEGDWYHYSFTGIDGKEYEFGYDQCILQADPVSCAEASEIDYARTFNNFYYVCDGEKMIFPWLKLEERKFNRANIHWDPVVFTDMIGEMTGLEVTSTYER